MSINLHLYATIEAVSKAGSHKIAHHFELWQTPTAVTRQIVESDNIMEAYLNWAKQFETIEKIPIYAQDDFFQSGGSIGFEEHNTYEEHVFELEKWLKQHAGWDINWFAM